MNLIVRITMVSITMKGIVPASFKVDKENDPRPDALTLAKGTASSMIANERTILIIISIITQPSVGI